MSADPLGNGKPGHTPPRAFSTLDRARRSLGGRETWVGQLAPLGGEEAAGMVGVCIASAFWAVTQRPRCPVQAPALLSTHSS